MSRIARLLYLGVGLLVAVLSAWALAALATGPDTNRSVAGIPQVYVLGILGSVSASAVFFIVTELLRWWADASDASVRVRLRQLTDELGLRYVYRQKGGADAKLSYAAAIKKAKRRVWAFGLSNGEFIKEHAATLHDMLAKNRHLEVIVCFPDPDTIMQIPSDNGRGPRTSLPDVFKIAQGKAPGSSATEIRNRVKELSALAGADRPFDLRYVSVPGYISGMVVDDVVYAFPYTAHDHDNTTTPYMELSSSGLLGESILSYFEYIAHHATLSREAS